nr:MAG TPA: hypothetical protein [Caudoviricetes sp.]
MGRGSGEAAGGWSSYLKPTVSGISACTIDRIANIDHNEGDGTSIFWTPSRFVIAPTVDHNYAT